MTAAPHISAIVTGHGEGRLAVASLRSFRIAVDTARAAGITVDCLFVLDRADPLTARMFDRFAAPGTARIDTDFGDQGAARNAAIEHCASGLVAFLDADDLWSADWLVQGTTFLAAQDDPARTIAHPEFNYFFENQATIFCHADQTAPDFSLDLLRIANYWDALCLCDRDIYRAHPFCGRDMANGWAFEDWHWNAETLAAGHVHRIVPDTVLFKRRQAMSQTVRATTGKARPRPSPLSRYDHPLYSNERTPT